MIQLENVEKYYGSRAVFRGINLVVDSGEFVAIMGSSGSGKSTLLNLIGGMDVPDQGRIIVDRDIVSSYTEEELTAYRRKKVGFIFQFFNLLPNLTVSENIEMPLLLNNEEHQEDRVVDYIRMVGLAGRENDYPSHSLGRRAAAGRDRAGAHSRARDHSCRRAYRQPGQQDRRFYRAADTRGSRRGTARPLSWSPITRT